MRIGILGAGAAGLATGFFLGGSGHDVQIHEATGDVGGLARSFQWHGFDCDLGPHRLFIEKAELLGEIKRMAPLQRIRRSSRIYLQGRWLSDPVNATEILLKFLPFQSGRILWSYLFRPQLAEDSFEALSLNRFGAGLHRLFFKPYSEKLFGLNANEIAASWGRRKLRTARFRDLWRRNSRLGFKWFYYPTGGGYGAICDGLYRCLTDVVRLRSKLVRMRRTDGEAWICEFDREGTIVTEQFDCIVSTLPLSYFTSLVGLHDVGWLLPNRSGAGLEPSIRGGEFGLPHRWVS